MSTAVEGALECVGSDEERTRVTFSATQGAAFLIAKKVHPDLLLSHRAARLVEDVSSSLLRRVVTAALQLLPPDQVMLPRDVLKLALIQCLRGALASHAYSHENGAYLKAERASEAATTWEARAELDPVSVLDAYDEVAPLLRGVSLTTGAVISIAAVRDYILWELLELAGKAAKAAAAASDERAFLIAPRHVALAVRSDQELNHAAGGLFAWSGLAVHDDAAAAPIAVESCYQGDPLFGAVRAAPEGAPHPDAAQRRLARRCVDLRGWGLECPEEGEGSDETARVAAVHAVEPSGPAYVEQGERESGKSYAHELAVGRAVLALACGAPANAGDIVALAADREDAQKLLSARKPPFIGRCFDGGGEQVLRTFADPYFKKMRVRAGTPLAEPAAATSAAAPHCGGGGGGGSRDDAQVLSAPFCASAADESARQRLRGHFPAAFVRAAAGVLEHFGAPAADLEEIDSQLALARGTFASALADWRAIAGMEDGACGQGALLTAFSSADFLCGRLSLRAFAPRGRTDSVKPPPADDDPFAWILARGDDAGMLKAGGKRAAYAALLERAALTLRGAGAPAVLLPEPLREQLRGALDGFEALRGEAAGESGPPPLRALAALEDLMSRVAAGFAASGDAALIARAGAFFYEQGAWRVRQARSLGFAVTDVAAVGDAGEAHESGAALARVLPTGTAPLAIPFHTFSFMVWRECQMSWACTPSAMEALAIASEDHVVALFAGARAEAQRHGRVSVHEEDLDVSARNIGYLKQRFSRHRDKDAFPSRGASTIQKAALRALARRAGVLRVGGGLSRSLSGSVYTTAAYYLEDFVRRVTSNTYALLEVQGYEQRDRAGHPRWCNCMESCHATTTATDMVRALAMAGVTLYGFGT
jgi:hypothetical protein